MKIMYGRLVVCQLFHIEYVNVLCIWFGPSAERDIVNLETNFHEQQIRLLP